MSDYPALLNQLSHANFLTEQDLPTAFLPNSGRFNFSGRTGPLVQYQYNKQVHGAVIVEAKHGRDNAAIEADGLWTKEPGFNIAVRTADCLPVLLTDKGRTMAMAVHAGWRGLTAGILSNAVNLFKEEGISTGKVTVAVGPAISREKYEVGFDVIESLFQGVIGLSSFEAGLCIAKGKKDRWFLDLQLAALVSLIKNGIFPHNIDIVQWCTFSDTSLFSYRREGKGVGSNISWIRL